MLANDMWCGYYRHAMPSPLCHRSGSILSDDSWCGCQAWKVRILWCFPCRSDLVCLSELWCGQHTSRHLDKSMPQEAFAISQIQSLIVCCTTLYRGCHDFESRVSHGHLKQTCTAQQNWAIFCWDAFFSRSCAHQGVLPMLLRASIRCSSDRCSDDP